MSIGYTNGAYNRASGTRGAFGRLSDHLVREGHPRMVSRSGDREVADQVAIFVSRYRQQASGSGSFGDVRYWDGSAWGYGGGTRWVRFSPAGTVAPPGNGSNHVKRRANDLLYPYNSNTAAARRAKTLGTIYGITREGENFGELWHWTFWGALGTISNPATAGETTGAWDTMATKQEIKEALDELLIERKLGPGGRNFWDSQKFIADGAYAGTAEKVWASPVAAQDGTGHLVMKDGKPVTFQAQGFLASIASQVGGTVADVDEKAIAEALAPLLTANLASLSDDDVQRIATAAADEQAKRLAG